MKTHHRWILAVVLVAAWAVAAGMIIVFTELETLVYINFSSVASAIWLVLGLLLLVLLPVLLIRRPKPRGIDLLNHINDAVQVYDRRSQLVWANARARDTLSSLPDIEIKNYLENALNTGRVVSQVISIENGQRVSVSAVPLSDSRVALIARPSRGNQKDFYETFIHRIVHDMRNPLAGIVAHAANLAYIPGIPDDAAQSAETIEQEAQRLARLVDSLLFDARLAYLPLAPIQLDLLDVIEDALFSHDDMAREKDLAIEMDSPGQGLALRGDHDLLVRAFANIIDNAVKYSTQGGRIHIHILNEPNQYVIAISDNGEGIPEQYLPDRIFEPLVRARKHGSGSGLGLSIVKKIVEMHFGRVKASLNDLGGTTITIFLPKEARL